MATNKNLKIKITWKTPVTPKITDQDFIWEMDYIKTPSSIEENRLEKEIGLSKGTISVLKSAFKQNLDRFTHWNLTNIKKTSQNKFQDAASIFKRGVSYTNKPVPTKNSGSYNLIFCKDENYLFNKLKNSTFVVADKNVIDAWPFLEDDIDFLVKNISENIKDLSLVAQIIQNWKSSGKPDNWVVVGGGILTDVTSFAAALTNSKITIVPTTLLALVDASIGGKTGVNFLEFGKNQIGRFYFPSEVILWCPWLKTLKDKDIYSGGSECLKHTILTGDKRLSKQTAKALSIRDLDTFKDMLPDLIDLKRRVVNEDSTETGKRVILNFGHTMAHALEGRSQKYDDRLLDLISHGEAVAVGICFSAYLSNKITNLPDLEKETIWNLLKQANALPNLEILKNYLVVSSLKDPNLWKDLLVFMGYDKKNKTAIKKSISFILLEKFGKVARNENNGYVTNISKTDLRTHWNGFVSEIYS